MKHTREGIWKNISIHEKLKEELDNLKIIPNEPYYAIIERLLNKEVKLKPLSVA